MDLSRALLRFSAGRPHVLLVDVPGGTATRIAAEGELRRRGWPAAESPVDADMLLIAGSFGPRFRPMVGRLWRQMPKPRVFVPARSAAAVSEALDDACRALAAGGHTWEVLPGEEHDDSEPAEAEHDEDAGGYDGGQDHGGGHDHDGGHDHGGGHEHGGGMEMPGGLGMADRGADRDGLALDRLHVPIGPLLPDWPPGLIVYTTLQGDVVQEARVETLHEDVAHEDFWAEPWPHVAGGQRVIRGERTRRYIAAYVDSLAGFLRVAGWPDQATAAARLRDELLAGASADHVAPRLRRLRRRVRGSRALRWLTDGLGALPRARAEAAGLGGTAVQASRSGGDVTARWLAWLVEIDRALPGIDDTEPLSAADASPRPSSNTEARSAAALAVLPELLEGVELAAARLIVASLAPEIAGLDASGAREVAGD